MEEKTNLIFYSMKFPGRLFLLGKCQFINVLLHSSFSEKRLKVTSVPLIPSHQESQHPHIGDHWIILQTL